MHNAVDLFRCQYFRYQRGIADIAPDEAIHRVLLNRCKVFQVAGIGEDIQVDYTTSRVSRHEMIDEVCADETRAARYHDSAWHPRCRHPYLRLHSVKNC